jgi:hypothetical protein
MSKIIWLKLLSEKILLGRLLHRYISSETKQQSDIVFFLACGVTCPYSSVVEHFIRNEKVRGSIPRAGFNFGQAPSQFYYFLASAPSFLALSVRQQAGQPAGFARTRATPFSPFTSHISSHHLLAPSISPLTHRLHPSIGQRQASPPLLVSLLVALHLSLLHCWFSAKKASLIPP